MRNLDVPLRDVGGGRRLRLDRDLDRIVQVLLGDLADRRRHRRREQRHLLVLRSVGEDALDVLLEAHLEHLVGLVENEVLELGQVERALLQVVDDTTRAYRRRRVRRGAGPTAGRRSSGHRRSAARAARGCARSTCRTPRRPASPVRASARGPAPAAACCDRSIRDRIGTANAAVLPVPVCAGRRRPCLRAAAEWWRPGSARATRSPRRTVPSRPDHRCRGRQMLGVRGHARYHSFDQQFSARV